MLPALEQGTGSVQYSATAKPAEEQGLDSLANPQGAPGSVIDLSMDGTGGYKKKSEGDAASSLYQAPEVAAPGAPITAIQSASPNTLASALKDVSKKADAGGWGGAKVQKAFNAPKGNGGFRAWARPRREAARQRLSGSHCSARPPQSRPDQHPRLGRDADKGDKDGPSFGPSTRRRGLPIGGGGQGADASASMSGTTFDGSSAKPGPARR